MYSCTELFQINFFIPTLDKQLIKAKSELALKVILLRLYQNNKIWLKQWKFRANFRFLAV